MYGRSLGDTQPWAASEASGAQFIALLENIYTHPQSKYRHRGDELYRQIARIFPESKEAFRQLSVNMRSGVRPVTMIELVNDNTRWHPTLETLMESGPPQQLDQEIKLPVNDTEVEVFDQFYICKSYAVNTDKLMALLRRDLLMQGGEIHYKEITRKSIQDLEGTTILAVGASAVHFTDVGFDDDWGISARIEGYVAPDVMISASDMVIVPHREGVAIGGGSFYRPPSERQASDFIERVRHLGQCAVGPWKPLPRSIFDSMGDIRAAHRPTSTLGLAVRQNPYYDKCIDLIPPGHCGMTMSFGMGKEAVALAQRMTFGK